MSTSTATKGSGWVKRFSKFLKGDQQDDGEWRAFCPIHEDPETSKTPSASFNFEKGKFMCFGGCGGMSVGAVWSIVREDMGGAAPESNVRSIASAKTTRTTKQLPDEEQIKKWRAALAESPTALAKMTNDRGLDLDTIEFAEIGYNATLGRFTLPVRDQHGALLNVRLYKPDAKKDQDKMRNISGHGDQTLYLTDALEHRTIILTEGELDALVARRHGLISMTHTSGAGSWNSRWSPLLEGKIVYIIYDNDDGGRAGAIRTANSVKKYAAECYIIRLPLPNKGDDLTDYFVKQGHSAQDLKDLLEDQKHTQGSRAKKNRSAGEPIKVSLEQSMMADFADSPITFNATIAGKVQPAYMLPKKAVFSCGMDWGDKCKHCPMVDANGQLEKSFNDKDPFLLDLIDKSRDVRNKSILKEASIPQNCPKVDVDEDQVWNVEELVVIPSVDDRTEEAQSPISRKVYNVGKHATPLNTTAGFIGFNTTDPKNGRGILQTWESEPTLTNLDKFEMTMETKEALSIFRPNSKQTPGDKLEAIARDIEANVTRIYGRPELHIGYDLVWHSVMDFRFRGVQLGKGWLELLVMGDTRTGKSEAALRLTEHYEAGILKSCEGATFAGLVGGAQQMGNSWMITWGTIPLQDRRLVVLDEVSGIGDKGIIEQMSAVRSSGRAQVTKIVSQETSARTRLIWISNPPDGRVIGEMNRGAIDAIEKLVRNPEDVARFDIAMSAASSDVDPELINAIDPPKVRHKYTKELCSLLVAWVWSRKADDIWWEEGVEDYVMEQARDFGSHYVSEPPLVQTENVRVKLARVAVAIAARLFSTDESGEKVLVKSEHVDTAVDVLNRLYGMKSFGYLEHSTKEIRARRESERNRKACRRYLINNEAPLSALKFVINDTHFRVRDFEEFGGMTREEAQIAVMELMKMKMIKRQSKGYVKMQPELIQIVKTLEAEEDEV